MTDHQATHISQLTRAELEESHELLLQQSLCLADELIAMGKRIKQQEHEIAKSDHYIAKLCDMVQALREELYCTGPVIKPGLPDFLGGAA
jgi:hypothetical protein